MSMRALLRAVRVVMVTRTPLCQVKEEQIAADLAARKERYRQRRLAFAAAQVRPGITTRTAHSKALTVRGAGSNDNAPRSASTRRS